MIGSDLMEKMAPVDFNVFGVTISDTIISMWLVIAFLIISAFLLTRKLKTIPDGKQLIVEIIVENTNNFVKSFLGKHWKPFAPYIGTIFLFLVFANTISIFDIIPSTHEIDEIFNISLFKNAGIPNFEITPPTRDFHVTLVLALMSILTVIIAGIAVKKPKNFIKWHFEPFIIIGLYIRILEYFTRPLSLCFRLFGNILASYIVMEMVYSIPFAYGYPGFLSIYFDLFDGIIQAVVFVFLTSLYISEAIE